MFLECSSHRFNRGFGSGPELQRSDALIEEHTEAIGNPTAGVFGGLEEGGAGRPIDHIKRPSRALQAKLLPVPWQRVGFLEAQ